MLLITRLFSIKKFVSNRAFVCLPLLFFDSTNISKKKNIKYNVDLIIYFPSFCSCLLIFITYVVMKNNANCNALYLSTTNWSYLIRVMHLPCFPHFPGCNTKSSCSFYLDDLPSLILKLGIIYYFVPFVSALCIRINVYINIFYKNIVYLDIRSHQFSSHSGTIIIFMTTLYIVLWV